MSQSNETLKIEFTGKTVREYFNLEGWSSCSICGRTQGEESVIIINDVATSGRVKIVEIVFEKDGFEYRFPICTEHLEMLQGIVSITAQILQADTGDVSATKY